MARSGKFPVMEAALSLLLVIILVLSFTNPNLEDFKSYFKEELISQIDDEKPIVRSLVDIFEDPAWKLLEPYIERKNYLLFSVYSLELDEGNESFRYLGILNRFHKME